MWLGSLGLWLERALVSAGLIAPPTPLEHLAWLRLPGALLQSLLVPAAYLVLRRIVAPATALVAMVLWACSPYLIAHSRLLHLDALLTSFVTLSLLLLCVVQSAKLKVQNGDGAPRTRTLHLTLCTSGLFAGLALLTKGPALILLPFAALVTIAACRLQIADWGWRRSIISTLRSATLRYALWLAVALLTVLALWPALWVNPLGALERYTSEIVSNGGRPNGDGQFFLGRAVDDPGPLFYPLANLFRATPAMLLGLLAYFGFAIVDFGLRRNKHIQDPKVKAHNRTLLVLLAFVLFWTLVMTLGPKKFDRYVLPTWPALCVLAGAGLARIADWLVARRTARAGTLKEQSHQATGHVGRWSSVGLVLAFALVELSQPLRYHPYYLSYYNPLLGGGPVAERTLLIGWGEGMDQVGAWLSARPDIGYGPVLSALGRTLQPFVSVDVRDVDEYGAVPANYAVVYLESVQRAANPPLYAALQETVPLRRVVIHGIEYARIHQLARPFATPLPARFGEGLRLRGVTLEREARRIVLTPSWDVRAPLPGDYIAFVHLIDTSGARVAQVAVAPGGGDAPATSEWQPGQQIAVPLPLDLPPGLPPGEYRLTLGLFDAASGARLPLAEGSAADSAVAGDNALLVETLQLP
jgi:4-amino-4-deoxy-L-arabinose transferase-like glycosyltransferase